MNLESQIVWLIKKNRPLSKLPGDERLVIQAIRNLFELDIIKYKNNRLQIKG